MFKEKEKEKEKERERRQDHTHIISRGELRDRCSLSKDSRNLINFLEVGHSLNNSTKSFLSRNLQRCQKINQL